MALALRTLICRHYSETLKGCRRRSSKVGRVTFFFPTRFACIVH
jgi:hypothetical protein